MKRFPLYLIVVIFLSLVLNACKKDDNGIVPKPDEPPPVEEEGLTFPKKEMRAVWMTTAWGLDWPQSVHDVASQKQQYINYLDKFKSLNINAIFFQVKGMGDAFYNSS